MRKIQQLCTSMLLTLALMANMVPAGLAAEEPDRDLSLEPEYTDLSAADAPGAENPITDFETLQAAVETAEGTAEEPAVIYISGMMEQTAQLALKDGQYIHLVGVGAGENGLVRAESFTNNGDMIDVGRNDNSNVCGLTLENIVLDGGAQWADAAGGTNDGISAGNSSLLSVRGSAEAYLLDGTTLRNNEKSGGGAGVWIVGELYVDGGEIVDNAAAGTNRGGAAYLRNPESVLNLLSGEISNNYAAVGGGVYINNQGTVNLGGGSIAGNEIPSGDSNLDVNNGSVQITGAFETGDQVGLTLPELKNGAVAASRADGCDPEDFAAAAQALTLDGSPDYQLSVQGDEIVLSDNTTGCGCPEGFTKGNGTEESPYCVSNEQQLRHVAEHPDACICLEDDIVLTGEWTPFAFQGSLDGQGRSISGLQVTAGAAGGLFSAVDAGGRICDLTVSGSLTVGRGMTMAGGIAAELNGDVENVTSDVDITVTEEASEAAMVGGVAGRSTGTVVDSTYSGVIDDQRSSNDGYLGAIIGRADIEAPEGMPTMITAHAGFAAPGGPSDTSEDNTIDNIIKAVNYGPDAIEVDVQSADSDNDGVREMWLGHDGVDYEKNPTLEETLRLLMGEHPRSDELNENGATVRIQLDSKEDGNLGKILDVIHEVGFPVDRVILAGDNSYDHVLETIDEIREAVEEGMDFWMNPNFIIGTGWEGYRIMINDTDRFLEQIRNLNLPVFTVNSSYQFMSDELIQRFREEGINVSLWTLNDTETIQDNFLRGVYNTTSRLLEILEYRDLLTTGVSGNTFDGSLPQVGSEKTEEEPGEGGGGGSGSSGGSDPVYSPALDVSSGGSVQVSPRNPSEDDEVTIRVDPDSGYEVGTVTVTDRNGREVDVIAEGGNTYTFLQPQGRVTISVTFVRESGSTFFADVPEAFWAYDEIKWAYDNGYVNGTSANTFSPNASISRQQVWMILARLSGTAPADMAAARSWAVANGISDGTNPGSAVTRQQLVALLYRYAQMMGSDNGQREDLAGFPDAGTVSAYAVEPMQWSVANGIVAGTSQGTLNPAGTATRAQFAAILYRFANQAG